MPFLGEQFNHTLELEIESFEDCGLSFTNTDETKNCYYKSHAKALYNDIKSLLQKTDIENIIYDDENFTFTIFSFKISIFCFSHVRSSGYDKNYSIIPYCLFKDIYRNTSTTLKDTFVLPTNITTNSFVKTNITNQEYYQKYGYFLSIIDSYNTKNEVNYTLHLYYNTNFICLQYISTRGAKIPLITLIEGYTPDNVKVVYACASCNSICIDSSSYFHYHTLYNTTANKLIKSSQYTFNVAGDYGVFDMNIYPRREYLKNIGLLFECTDISYTGLNKVYLNTLTAYGGIIKFDNVYNVTRLNNDGYESQFDLDTQYTINEENYYCPGDNFRYITNIANNNNVNVSYNTCHRLLLKI